MKTLNREVSEELFNRIVNLKYVLQHMAGAVQNPDFVNEDNAKENYDFYKESYYNLMAELSKINGKMQLIHQEIDDKNYYIGK